MAHRMQRRADHGLTAFQEASWRLRQRSVLGLGVLAVVLSACQGAHGVPIVSRCNEDVTVVLHYAFTYDKQADYERLNEDWDTVEVSPEGGSRSVELETDRVWFENADGEVLNEVTLTAQERVDPKADFAELVIGAEHCAVLEPAPAELTG